MAEQEDGERDFFWLCPRCDDQDVEQANALGAGPALLNAVVASQCGRCGGNAIEVSRQGPWAEHRCLDCGTTNHRGVSIR